MKELTIKNEWGGRVLIAATFIIYHEGMKGIVERGTTQSL